MDDGQLKDEVVRLRTLQARERLARADYVRGVHQLSLELSERQVSVALTAPREAIQAALEEAAQLPPVPDGFHGGDPTEIINRFATGQITREQVIDELVRWTYEPSDQLDGPLDDILVSVPGSFDDVVRAVYRGLLPGDVYDEILHRAQAQETPDRSPLPGDGVTKGPEEHL